MIQTSTPVRAHPVLPYQESLISWLPVLVAIFISNPFEGEVNPGTLLGVKRHSIPTADHKNDELLTMSQEEAAYTMSVFCQDSDSFGQVVLANNVKVMPVNFFEFWWMLMNAHLIWWNNKEST